MRERRSARRHVVAAAVVLTAFSGSVASADQGVPLTSDQVAAAVAAGNYVECVAGGPTAQDTAIANAVRGRLTSKMSGGLSPEQASCARAIYANTINHGYDAHAAVIEVCAAIVEASLVNVTYGDSTSVGLFQMLDDKGTVAQRTDVTYETRWFLTTMNARYPNGGWESQPVGVVAQAVERSAFPERYPPNAADAQTIIDAVMDQVTAPLYRETHDGSSDTWSGFQAMPGVGADRFDASAVAVAGFQDGSAQVVAIGDDGALYRDILPSGDGWEKLAGVGSATSFQAGAVGAAGIDTSNDLQVVAVGNDGLIYHDIWFAATRTWQGWGQVPGFGGARTFAARTVAIAGMPDGSAQLVATARADGTVYHTIRNADGTWQPWGRVAGFGGAAAFQAGAVAITGLANGDSQTVAVGNDGNLYHTIRSGGDRTWQPWGRVDGLTSGTGFRASAVGIAAVNAAGDPRDGETDVLAVGGDGLLYQNARYTSKNWQGWKRLAGHDNAPTMPSLATAVTGMPGTTTIQVVASGK
ncbi:hypothetical protein GCM10029964_060270 [Kibdelosporangium lantanae]